MKRIAVAIDTSDANFDIHAFANQTPQDTIIKVGLQYFTAFGMPKNLNRDIFLDLKLHDIPNTIYHAVKNVCADVHFMTIYAGGEQEIIKAAVRARNEVGSVAKIICVTKLTSQNIENEADVLNLTKISIDAGADGIVCSALEAESIRHKIGKNPIIITPGIRPQWYQTVDDQVRTCTPKSAFNAGSNILVIGRPIMSSPNPIQTLKKIYSEDI